MLPGEVILARETAPSQGITVLGSASVGAAVAWIRYEGDTGSGATLQVDASTGDLYGTTDGTTADTQWLESGGTAGTIDVSDANANSMGEVIDIINECDNWCGVLLAAQRSDLSSNTILTVAEVDMSTAAMKATGLYLFHDPVVADQTSIYSVAHAFSAFNPAGYVKGDDPDEGCMSVVTYVGATSDFSAAGQLVFVNANTETSHKGLSISLTDNTLKEIGNYVTPVYRSMVGYRLIVRVENDQNASANATKLACAGYSFDLTGKKNPCESYPITNASG
jgi:hypothetical protein